MSHSTMDDRSSDADSVLPPDGIKRTAAASSVPLLTAIGAAIVTLAISLEPALQFAQWHAVVLAVAGGLALWCLYVLRSAIGQLLRGVPGLDVLAIISVAATYVWALATIGSDRAGEHIAASVAVATLLIVTGHIAGLSDVAMGHSAVRRVVVWWAVALLLAVVVTTWLLWWRLDGVPSASSSAIAVLVAGCPGAFAIAIPAAILTGTKRGMPLGLRFGGMAALEAAHRIDTVVLDKNRTVTTGELSVSSIDPIDPDHLRNMTWFAGALEHTSNNPIGRAIAKLAGIGRLAGVEHQDGLGVTGSVDRHPVRVGRPSWIGIESQNGIGTTVAVEVDGRPLGHITVADTIRPRAKETVDRLRRMGLAPILVSDRSELDTAHVAQQAGIETYFSEPDATGRANIVADLQQHGHAVAMVGNPDLNSGALAVAELGILIEATGDKASAPRSVAKTDIASHQIIIDDVDATAIGDALALSRTTLTTARTNRRLALATAIIAVPIAAAGLLTPLFAALVPAACTLAIAGNSQRIRRPGYRDGVLTEP